MTDKRSPLHWPEGRPKTAPSKRKPAQFRDYKQLVSVHVAIGRLQEQLDHLGVQNMILSTNLQLRLDGMPRSGQPVPSDPGAALYFTLAGRETVLACDKWDRVADNIVAIAHHIDAIRKMERMGVGTIEQAFRGYQALPAPGADRPARPWRTVLGWTDSDAGEADLNTRYRARAKVVQGDETALLELNLARDDARREMNL